MALKVGRRGGEDALRPRLERERTVLDHLDGGMAPRAIAAVEVEGRPCLVLSWVEGVDAEVACAELRGPESRADLLHVLAGITRAYAALHGRGVVHGDVHPGNLLIDGRGTITVVDFGLAGLAGLPPTHGGIPFFHPPEVAGARRHRPPPVDEAGEQFSVGALLYRLATGEHWCDFSLEQEAMMRQIREARVRPFAELGLSDWPALERVLARALAKAPADRFPSMAEFVLALERCTPVAGTTAASRQPAGSSTLVAELVRTIALDGDLYRRGLPHGPLCSVNVGAAGIAYAAYRLACIRDDPELLALADLWIRKALHDTVLDDAFANSEMDMRPETVGTISPYHTLAGVHLVRALIARSSGDAGATSAAVEAFVRASGPASKQWDLTLGRCGTVIACALLLEGTEDQASEDMRAVRALGSDRLASVWSELEALAPVPDCHECANLGLAHGWSGLIYTALRWHRVSAEPLPAATVRRLDELLAVLRPEGRGVWFPWRDRPGPTDTRMAGWCNGTAGLVHLCCLAFEVLQEPRCLAVAERAAWHAFDSGGGETADLCCGLAGRGLALAELLRVTGDDAWLRRARVLIDRAAALVPRQVGKERPWHSLYKGALGVGVAVAELERPDFACMPVLGREGWSSA